MIFDRHMSFEKGDFQTVKIFFFSATPSDCMSGRVFPSGRFLAVMTIYISTLFQSNDFCKQDRFLYY